MTKDNGTAVVAEAETAIVPRPVRGDVIEVYEAMLEQVPDAGGDGIEGILEQIDTATSLAELNDPWRAGGLGKYVDEPLVLSGIEKAPSDFGAGLSYFLIVRGAVRATGEKVAVTTGSLAVMAQLLKIWQLGAYPVAVIPRLAKRATKEGYFPQHLEVLGGAE